MLQTCYALPKRIIELYTTVALSKVEQKLWASSPRYVEWPTNGHCGCTSVDRL
jgi:hypothetical protein